MTASSQIVILRQSNRRLRVPAGTTILEAALAAGIPYPHGCRSGRCGACKSVLIEGQVTLRPFEATALGAEERAAGLILACRAEPRTACEVAWLDAEERAAHPLQKLTCTVSLWRPATHDIHILRLRPPSGQTFAFSPGQFASLRFCGPDGPLPPRDYSMASQPGAPEIEFHLRLTPGGTVGPLLRAHLALDDRVALSGPYGVSYLRRRHRGPIIAIAGGSGLAPIQSIVEAALAAGMAQPIHLYFGVRTERDLYLVDHFSDLAARHANFRFTPVLSQPDRPTIWRTGLLCEALAADFAAADLSGAKAYLAGPPAMVETCTAALTARGLHPQDCHADAFYTEADKTALGAVTRRE